MDARGIGWGHTPFDVHKSKGLEALTHAGLALGDAGFGRFNNGLTLDVFACSPALQLDRVMGVENACALGAATYCSVLEVAA